MSEKSQTTGQGCCGPATEESIAERVQQMAQMMGQFAQGCDCAGMMQQMMGPQKETQDETAASSAQESA